MYVLLVLFASPFLVSWWMYYFTGLGRDGGAYSHGQLILPPRYLEDMILVEPGAGMKEHRLHGKWNLLYITEGGCDSGCGRRIIQMRRLWLATGRDSYRLQRVLLINNNSNPAAVYEQLKDHDGQLVFGNDGIPVVEMVDRQDDGLINEPLEADRFYVIDPHGNIMMSYPPGTDPSGIIKDLKRLLKYSRIG